MLGLAKREGVDIGVERMVNVADGNVGVAVDRKEVDVGGSGVGDKVGGVMEVVVGKTAGGMDKVGNGYGVGMEADESVFEEAGDGGVEKGWSGQGGACWWEW
jgi:hypothetical protein